MLCLTGSPPRTVLSVITYLTPSSKQKLNKNSALPTFEWVKNSVQTSAMGARNPEESAIFRALDRVEFESSAVKEDGRLQMLPIAEAIRVFLIV
jgi:hypothetical protein